MNHMFRNIFLQLLLFPQLEVSPQPALRSQRDRLPPFLSGPAFLKYSLLFFSLQNWPDRKIKCWMMAMSWKISSACMQALHKERKITSNSFLMQCISHLSLSLSYFHLQYQKTLKKRGCFTTTLQFLSALDLDTWNLCICLKCSRASGCWKCCSDIFWRELSVCIP